MNELNTCNRLQFDRLNRALASALFEEGQHIFLLSASDAQRCLHTWSIGHNP